MDYHRLPRKELQLLCKKHGIPANKRNVFMADALAKKRLPLSEVSGINEAKSGLLSVTPSKIVPVKEKGEGVKPSLFSNTPFLKRGSKKKEESSAKGSDVPVKQAEQVPTTELQGRTHRDSSNAQNFAAEECERLGTDSSVVSRHHVDVQEESKEEPATTTDHREDTPIAPQEVVNASSALRAQEGVNVPFVFQAKKPVAPKKVKDTTKSVTGSTTRRAGSRAPNVRQSKQVDPQPRRAADKDPVLVAKAKSDAYVNPSKKLRLVSESNVEELSSTLDTLEDVLFQPDEAVASVEEVTLPDLPEWAKDFKKTRAEQAVVTDENPGQSVNLCVTDQILDQSESFCVGLTPLRSIEDKVNDLLSRIQAFCWKAEVDYCVVQSESNLGDEAVDINPQVSLLQVS